MKRIALAAALTLLAVPCLAATHKRPAPEPHHDPSCGPLAGVVEGLAGKYHETPRWAGKPMHGGPGALMLTQAPDGSTWTLLRLGQDEHGQPEACIVAAGVDARTPPFDAPAAAPAPDQHSAPAPDDDTIHGSTDGWRHV